LPAPQVFKNGQKMETIIGAVPKTTLVKAIEKVTGARISRGGR
jgi:hypothetical protein